MEHEILKTVAQMAGIGGISLGVLLLLFRDVIRKNIFSKLGSDNSYKLMQQIVVATWLIAVIGIVTWSLGAKEPKNPNNDVNEPNVVNSIQSGKGSKNVISNGSTVTITD